MTRRGLFAPLIGAVAAACSPLSALNALGPRDRGAGKIASGVRYGEDPRQTMDIYAPAGAAIGGMSPPTVVFFYGGGWDAGSKAVYGWAAQALAARGFVVFLPDYRVVPQVHFPAFIEDAAAATARAGDLAAQYGGDAGRLGVLGHSAGAHLAMMIALDRRYMAAVERPDLIRAAAGLAGPYDFLPFDVPASKAAFGRASDPTLTQPVTFVRADAPPLWLGHGAADTVVHAEDTTILNDRMRAVGGRAEAKLYPGLDHADLIATFSPLFRKKAPVLDDVAAFFRRELG
ncbi:MULTISPECIES: alpha/beta hydrolase [unclassified Brevundimonas]|uniref:alpha/beta hydrolase n=1 Tax=unclassified Brevundimonas TaxID=2622653 RepID=UPI003F91B7F1